MERFINDDYKVKAGGRNAVKITKDQLKELIHEYVEKYSEQMAEAKSDGFYYKNNMEPEDYLMEVLRVAPINKDVKYEFDDENYWHGGDRYSGYKTLDNDLTYFGFWAGGDWELGVFGIVYYDGKQLRAYIPTRGNMVNTKTKYAIGNSEDDDEILEKYGNNYKLNINAMIEEIKTRIIVKDDGSTKKKKSPMIVVRAALFVLAEDIECPEIELTLTSQKYWDNNHAVNDSEYIFEEDEVDEEFVEKFKDILDQNGFGEICESTFDYDMDEFNENKLRNALKKLWKAAKAIGVEMKGDPLTEAFIAGGPCPYENYDFEW